MKSLAPHTLNLSQTPLAAWAFIFKFKVALSTALRPGPPEYKKKLRNSACKLQKPESLRSMVILKQHARGVRRQEQQRQ